MWMESIVVVMFLVEKSCHHHAFKIKNAISFRIFFVKRNDFQMKIKKHYCANVKEIKDEDLQDQKWINLKK